MSNILINNAFCCMAKIVQHLLKCFISVPQAPRCWTKILAKMVLSFLGKQKFGKVLSYFFQMYTQISVISLSRYLFFQGPKFFNSFFQQLESSGSKEFLEPSQAFFVHILYKIIHQ